MESTLQIMPVQRISRNFGEYAEEAVIIEEPIIKQKRPLFIEANTIEASLCLTKAAFTFSSTSADVAYL